MENNKIELQGIFANGYGIIPKQLFKIKIGIVKIKTPTKIINVKGNNIKLILGYMLSNLNNENECIETIETISNDLGVSKETVIYAIKGAELLKLITVKKIFPNNKLKKNNKYILDFLDKV